MKAMQRVATLLLLVGVTVLSACGGAPQTTPSRNGEGTTVTGTTSTPSPTTGAPSYSPSAPPVVIQQYPPSGGAAPTTPTSGGTIGLSTGGAKDITSFRDNVANGYLPLPTDVTYEGLFYDYFFDTGQTRPAAKLYDPSYAFAVTRDPFSRQTEYYLSVGLNSGLKESDFERKRLNLVIVLDVSGSMSEYYDQYYYDRAGHRIDAYAEEGINRPNKMDSAQDAVISILNQLTSDDQFAIVLFNGTATLAKPMGLVRRTSMGSIRDHILDTVAGGSTNLDAGLDMATAQFRGLAEINSYDYENRIIVLTDAQPNTGDYSASGLSRTVERNAESRIYTTFIGIGVDFNSQLIELVTKTKGANYYTVHSPREFRQRINEEFDFMVTPLIFDLRLDFESRGWRIEKVYGSPEADEATGSLMKINTLFPSQTEGGETRGGLVLLKLRRISSTAEDRVYLRVTYEDRNGRRDSSEAVLTLETTRPEYFDNTGIRKGVLLTRYASLLKNWMIDERSHLQYSRPWDPIVREDTGIILPPETTTQWERQSMPLFVSDPYLRLFRSFRAYFQDEMDAIGDFTLEQEMDILDELTREGRRVFSDQQSALRGGGFCFEFRV